MPRLCQCNLTRRGESYSQYGRQRLCQFFLAMTLPALAIQQDAMRSADGIVANDPSRFRTVQIGPIGWVRKLESNRLRLRVWHKR